MALDGKVAIVTGAARGIGRAIAERLARDGADVVIADVADEGQEVADQLVARGDSAHFIACDVGERLDVRNLVTGTIDRFGAVDVLVNNAGIVHGADFLDIEEEDFDRVIRTNLKGAFLVGQAAAKRMVAQIEDGRAPGAIINMSSINAQVAIPTQVPYCTSKGGLAQLTKVMALSLAPHRIRVNAIGPGSILTEMLEAVNSDPSARGKILSRTPLGYMGAPSEIASVAAFLASDDASYITGETIFADGGRLALNYTVPVAD
ncbi:MAG: SDR family NAD(P)-dependent oxidoreductase [Pseudomonadota bacterium]